MEENDIEIKEIENYFGSKSGEAFSHSQLIMIAMKKCIDAGCKEMREGYFNSKTDRYGNVTLNYISDTRKEFIEAIETLQMVMADDIFDGEKAKTRIENIKKRLRKSYTNFCRIEQNDWVNMHGLVKQKLLSRGIYFRKNMLSNELPYAIEYLMARVSASRKIFAVLTRLTKDLDYYKEEMFEG